MVKHKKAKNSTHSHYQDALMQIENDSAQTNSSFAQINDSTLVNAYNKDFPLLNEYSKRDRLYSELLFNYIDIYSKKASRNQNYKLTFFIVVIVILILLIVVPVVISLVILFKDKASVSDIALIIGSTTSIISAILVLPKIIAEHLFPKDEDSNMIDMVKNMQSNDAEIRTLLSKENNNSNNEKTKE